jgi:hypothetical protein
VEFTRDLERKVGLLLEFCYRRYFRGGSCNTADDIVTVGLAGGATIVIIIRRAVSEGFDIPNAGAIRKLGKLGDKGNLR